MRKININTLKKSFHKEIKDLPFVITSFGKDVAVVATPEQLVGAQGAPEEAKEKCANCGVELPPAYMPIHAKITHGVG